MPALLVTEIAFCDHLPIIAHFAEQNGAVLLDSAELRAGCGRYSYIAIDPFQTLVSKNGVMQLNGEVLHGNPFQVLSQQLSLYPTESIPDLPPFQGGVLGYFSYDLVQHLETISLATDDIDFPDM